MLDLVAKVWVYTYGDPYLLISRVLLLRGIHTEPKEQAHNE